MALVQREHSTPENPLAVRASHDIGLASPTRIAGFCCTAWSSMMLLRWRTGELATANRPSERTGPGAVPGVLCIRRSEQSN